MKIFLIIVAIIIVTIIYIYGVLLIIRLFNIKFKKNSDPIDAATNRIIADCNKKAGPPEELRPVFKMINEAALQGKKKVFIHDDVNNIFKNIYSKNEINCIFSEYGYKVKFQSYYRQDSAIESISWED